MKKYKIHYGSDGSVCGFGPNIDEYQPHIVSGDTLVLSDAHPQPSEMELCTRLRAETERRLAATDKYATVDFPDNALREKMLAYRADLRALNRQPGAPWDGGGDATPWPELPDIA